MRGMSASRVASVFATVIVATASLSVLSSAAEGAILRVVDVDVSEAGETAEICVELDTEWPAFRMI